MALSIETSPLRAFVENVASGATPSVWLWQIGVGGAAVLLGWGVARAGLRRAQPGGGHWKFGRGEFARVAAAIFAYLFTVLGRFALARHQPVVLLDILAVILVATIALRVAVYILGRVLPEGQMLRSVLRTLAWLAWIGVVLHVTGLLPEVIHALDETGFTVGTSNQRVSLWLIAQGLAALALTLAIALWLARITEDRVMAAQMVDLSTRVVVSKLVRVAAVFLAVLVALPLVGIDITALSIFGGALGVGLGFGLQKIAANYVSGFIVLLDHSLRIGDTVTIDGRRGQVKEIASRYTVIKGGDGTESIVPNEKLITEIVNHHTYSDARTAVALPVSVAYGTDVDRACAVLLEVARSAKRVIADPAPVARVRALGDHGIQLELTAWIAEPSIEGEIRSELYRGLLKAFAESRIEIPCPRRDVHLHTTAVTELDRSKTTT